MMHKTDSGLRPYYLTHEFTIHDAPFDDEVVIAIGGASSGRAHARTGDVRLRKYGFSIYFLLSFKSK